MKHAIRKEIRTKLSLLPEEERLRKSELIRVKLFRGREFRDARCVMWYVSTEEEVDTRRMIEETLRMGKRVCVPVVLKGSKKMVVSEIQESDILHKGCYGIYQPSDSSVDPVPLEEIDLVVVPGVAFDHGNVRLGRGHGYYDRFLCNLPKDVTTIGLAFDVQLVEKLPRDSHDVPVSKTITA